MLLKEIIQRVQSLYSKGVQSVDSRLSARHIYHKILTTRTRLLSEQINKKQKISDWNYQTLSCVELIKVPNHQCPCIPPSGCEILRSKYKLPKPLTSFNSNMIKAVSSIDGSIKYSEISLLEKNYSKGNRYTIHKPDYFILDGYLYLTHSLNGPRIATITALFENPSEVKEFENFCGENCVECDECISPLDQEFPVDADKVDLIVEFSVKELVEAFNVYGREDVTPNSMDDSVSKGKE